ncbi:MAG TPA: trimethylamine methyltransferase family protein, partial [Anaerolineae bacterium]|nr:trimethylamine methyltransferase family protein [Anaerolineae bacterium]
AEVHDERASGLLLGAGARAGDGDRIYLPAGLVRRALATVPPVVRVCNRAGQTALRLEGYRSYFGAGSDTPFVLDWETGAQRTATLADVETAARVAHALPNIDFHMSLALASDAPAAVYDRYAFATMVRNTAKPIVITAADKAALQDILEMCYLIAGGKDAFLAHPFVVLYGEYISPLVHPPTALAKLLVASELGLPQVYTGSPLAGGTAPATFAGVLTVALADFFVGLTISQLVRPGAPILMGGVPSIFEMTHANISYGIEMHLLCAALADIGHHLQIPTWSVAGASDAKVIDEQAGIECASSVLFAGLSGANLIHDVGYLDMAMTGSLEMMVMADEVIAMARRALNGIEVNAETLAIDVIDRVGPGQQYLVDEHTLKHFRQEFWFPTLISRESRPAWERAGSRTFAERARARLQRIVCEHKPKPLSAGVDRAIDAILQRITS